MRVTFEIDGRGVVVQSECECDCESDGRGVVEQAACGIDVRE